MSKLDELTYPTTRQVRDRCLCLHTQRAARALARRFDTAFRGLGITSGQFSLMMALNRPSPPAMGEVAEVLAMNRTTLTAALKPLERRGLVRSAPDERDRRTRLLSLTTGGEALLAVALPIWRRVHDEIDDTLADDPEVLRRGLFALSNEGQGTSR
jgi:DNA-binding MarR family transcriptional regulator